MASWGGGGVGVPAAGVTYVARKCDDILTPSWGSVLPLPLKYTSCHFDTVTCKMWLV